ncbi:MAG: CehA/McbA family metallohydrolase [Candidatus Promineifilaceae bacterium]
MFEAAGNIHMHTPYSDGMKWHHEIAEDAINAALDFVIITDHNIWVSGVEGYYENERGRVLLLVGEEVHNPRRDPQASHFLAIGAERELSRFASDPQRLIEETKSAGGLGYLAHPFDPPATGFNRAALDWQDWDVDGYHGLEIWNYMSTFKGLLTSRLRAVRAATDPDSYIVGAPPDALNKWDELLAEGKRIAAIGGSDAHGLTFTMWSITREIYPYEFLFRNVNTHILSKKEFKGKFEIDKGTVLEALAQGNCWIGYDLLADSAGFRFSAQGRTKALMGEELEIGSGVTLQVRAPKRCDIRMIHNGVIVKNCVSDTNMTYVADDPGAYRVECFFPHKGQERGWIYSNPIYLK